MQSSGRITLPAIAALLPLFLLACTCLPAYAQSDLNDPQCYQEAQDYMLLRINNERARNGLGSVRFDPAASELARRHAQDMLDKGYFSHWNMDGIKPTRRWNLMGGFDNVSENIYYRQGRLGDTRKIVDDAMETLLASPGHRKTILGPDYNRVGIAFSFNAQTEEVNVAQEFMTRLGGHYKCALSARAGSTVEVSGQIDPLHYSLSQIIVGWEESPRSREKRWLAKTSEYRDAEKMFAGYSPNPRTVFDNIQTFHDVTYDADSGSFSAQIRLDYKGKSGLYYVFVWLNDSRAQKPVLAAIATIDAQK